MVPRSPSPGTGRSTTGGSRTAEGSNRRRRRRRTTDPAAAAAVDIYNRRSDRPSGNLFRMRITGLGWRAEAPRDHFFLLRKVTFESFMLTTWSSILVMRSAAVFVRSQPTSLEMMAVPLMNSLALILYLKFPPVSLYLDTCMVKDSGL